MPHLDGILLVAVLASSATRAAATPEYDLSSLVAMSKCVVLAERGSKRTLSNQETSTSYRVLRVYKGPILPGQEIEVLGGLSDPTELGQSFEEVGAFRRPLELDRECVLFLEELERGDGRDPLFPDAPRFRGVLTGMLVLSEERVYRIDGLNDYSPSPPVSHERDPTGGRGGSRRHGQTLTFEEFEKDLHQAIRRVGAVEAALAHSDARERRAKLWPLVGERLPLQSLRDDRSSDVMPDFVAERICKVLARSGDWSGLLEAVSRTRNRLGWFALVRLQHTEILVPAVLNRDHPLHLRAAALWLLGRRVTFDTSRSDGVQPSVLYPLLRDEDAEIRRLAVLVFHRVLRERSSDRSESWERSRELALRALAEAWQVEKDTRVAAPIARAVSGLMATEEIFTGPKKLPPAYAVASFQPLQPGVLYALDFVCGSREGRRVSSPRWFVVVARKDGKEIRRLLGEHTFSALHRAVESMPESDRLYDALREELSRRSSSMRGQATTLYFEDPLPPGEYEIWIEGALRGTDPDAKPGFWQVLTQPPDAEFSSGKHKISVGEVASPLELRSLQGP